MMSILGYLIAIIIVILDYYNTDKRKKSYKLLRKVLLILTIISIPITVYSLYSDKHEELLKSNELSNNIARLNDAYSNLNTSIEPLARLAKDRFPNSSLNSSLQLLASDIQNLYQISINTNSKLSPRSITIDDANVIISNLKSHQNNSILITSILGDEESYNYANILKSIFVKSEWNVSGVDKADYSDPMQGLFIKINNDKYKNIAIILHDLFKEVNIDTKLLINYESNAQLELIIGSKNI